MKRFSLVLAPLCLLLPAFGGTITTSNLPTGTAIINVSATADGTAGFDSTQTYFYSPFSANGHLLEYTVQPGAYTFRIIDPADAASLFPKLSAGELNGIYTAWTYNAPYATDYMVFDSSAASNSAEPQLLAGAITRNVPGASGWIGGGWDSATHAYAAAKIGGFYNQIVSGVGGRYHGTVTSEYVFTRAETLIFAVPDDILGDNAGGVSVLISQKSSSSTPEPASVLLLVVGIFGIACLQLRGRFARRERS